MQDSDITTVAKALSHPVRLGIIRMLRERRVLSAVDFSKATGRPLPNCSFHLRSLRDFGIVAETERVPVRGSVEFRYSLTGKHAGITLGVLDLLSTA